MATATVAQAVELWSGDTEVAAILNNRENLRFDNISTAILRVAKPEMLIKTLEQY